jgi:AcrR family transcriptional regulator
MVRPTIVGGLVQRFAATDFEFSFASPYLQLHSMEKEISIPTGKARIIEVSFAAFNMKGFQAVSMDEVAKQLRISKKTIYKYFRTKEELLESALVDLFGKIEARLQQLDKQKSNKDVVLRYFDMLKVWKLALSTVLRTELVNELPYLADRIENFERTVLLRYLIGFLKDLRSADVIDYPSPSREFAVTFFQLMGSIVHASDDHATYFLQSLMRGMALKKKKKSK